MSLQGLGRVVIDCIDPSNHVYRLRDAVVYDSNAWFWKEGKRVVISEFDSTLPLVDQCYPGGVTYVWRLIEPPAKQFGAPPVAVTLEIFRFFIPSSAVNKDSLPKKAKTPWEQHQQPRKTVVAPYPALSPMQVRSQISDGIANVPPGQGQYKFRLAQHQPLEQRQYQHWHESPSLSPPGLVEYENTKALRHFYETNQDRTSTYSGSYGEVEEANEWSVAGSSTMPVLSQARSDAFHYQQQRKSKRKVRFASDFTEYGHDSSYGNAAADLV